MNSATATGYYTACAQARARAHEADLNLNPEKFVTLGHRLQWVREQASLAVYQMAECIGVGHKTIKRWEDDISTPTWFYLKLYSIALEIPLSILVDGVGPTARQVNPRIRNRCCLPERHWNRMGEKR